MSKTIPKKCLTDKQCGPEKALNIYFQQGIDMRKGIENIECNNLGNY